MNFFTTVPFTSPDDTIQRMKDVLPTSKVIHLKSAPESLDRRAYFEKLADSLGKYFDVSEDLETGKIQEGRWIDITYDPKSPNRYRSSNTRQPLHTDASYYPINNNIQYFYCDSRAAMGGATTFIDTKILVETLVLDGREDLLNRLQTTDVFFSKFERGKRKPILSKDGDDWRINFNYYCLDKGNSEEAKKLVDEFFDFLEMRVQQAGILMPLQLQKGESVFFHDEKVLHGRHAFFASKPGERRLVKGTIVEWEAQRS